MQFTADIYELPPIDRNGSGPAVRTRDMNAGLAVPVSLTLLQEERTG
jgi:hypothetical protein